MLFFDIHLHQNRYYYYYFNLLNVYFKNIPSPYSIFNRNFLHDVTIKIVETLFVCDQNRQTVVPLWGYLVAK